MNGASCYSHCQPHFSHPAPSLSLPFGSVSTHIYCLAPQNTDHRTQPSTSRCVTGRCFRPCLSLLPSYPHIRLSMRHFSFSIFPNNTCGDSGHQHYLAAVNPPWTLLRSPGRESRDACHLETLSPCPPCLIHVCCRPIKEAQ